MMVRGGLVLGGAFVMAGAALPWLTLYAGLQQYSGMIGLYGWVMFALGFFACIAGAIAPRKFRPFLLRASIATGVASLAFALWLYYGVLQIVERPDSVMLVAQSGPGLFVVLVGGALLVSAPLASRLFFKNSPVS